MRAPPSATAAATLHAALWLTTSASVSALRSSPQRAGDRAL
ncbi:hypothetical protein [Xanthomonas arboricola]|nr:hypothetical protein [Xanthomonas arboricola]WIX26038.1 hypothetical protein PUV44_04480 [Xanthomonas arboricola pv. corylina]